MSDDQCLHEFKNFHRQLCERFDYAHDEKDWRRDQVSLIEHIASLAYPPPVPGPLMKSFPLLSGGKDPSLDALSICYTVLNELTDGTDIEANLRYLIARFSHNVRREIPQ